MPKPYDVTTKDLLRRDPPSWLAYLGLGVAGPIEVVDADLSTVPAEGDRVYRIRGRSAHLVHVEMQSHPDPRLPRRLWRYNAMLDLKYDLRVRSIALLLRAAADSKHLTELLEIRSPDREPIATFHYRVIRAWEHPVEPLLTGPLATLPMAPIADVPVADLPEILEQIGARLAAEAPPTEAARMMSSTLILAGMRLDINLLKVMRGRLRTMNILKDSSYYQILLEEGKELGERTGERKGIRKTIYRLGRIRFGRLPRATRALIEAIDDLERLEALSERVLTASSWDDLLAVPKS